MKISSSLFGPVFALLLSAASAAAVVFTTDTSIGIFNTSYDGADIIISNCTVTVDGLHTFASLLITNGGVLTHSYVPGGSFPMLNNVTDEAQILSSTNPATLLNTNVLAVTSVTDPGHTITYTNGVDYVVAPQPDGTTQIQWTNTSSIADGASVLVSYSWIYNLPAGLRLTISNNVTVASGGAITANGIGYSSTNGPGGGATSSGSFGDGSGAGYGGSGGNSSSNAVGGPCYGSITQPADLGSGGGASYAGNGGSGGGLIQIAAGGNIQIDGTIVANGANATNNRAGGGAGGGIWLSAETVRGAGTIMANGGAGAPVYGGGGGGGRIAIQTSANFFSGTITAYGGTGANNGGAGTVFTQVTGQSGLLVVDNGGNNGANSILTFSNASDVVVRGHASAAPSVSFACNNLIIATNSMLTSVAQAGLNLFVSSNMTIQTGGSLNVDSLGYAGGYGTGAGHFYSGYYIYPCSGGGHGGNGALGSITNNTPGGGSYDSQSAPTALGSGGGNWNTSIGGAGGGAVQLNVSGTLQVDGTLSANGGNGLGTGGGGGSGGSIYLVCPLLAGAGSIIANGGNGVASYGGGGGGGCITLVSGTNLFTGNISAYGGGGVNWGGAGTIYLQTTNQTQLVLNNGNHVGASTPVQTASSANLIIQNGAVGTASSAVTFASLLVSSNAWMSRFTPSISVLTITGDATFQSGSGFIADLGGYGSGLGSGAGGAYFSSPYYPCGGGGHGGRGGSSTNASASGGFYFGDSPAFPAANYSGAGGGGYPPYSYGGTGGGFVQMAVNGTLRLDGFISANGGNGSGIGGGGGAGGGIYLSVGKFAGGGSISANGGNAVAAVGGGGGGGRIAVYFNTNAFAGTMAAFGGSGANYGGAGTIYLKTNSVNNATLMVDNGNNVGADTPYQTSGTTDLNSRNGGALSLSSSGGTFGNITIGPNGWLLDSNPSPSGVTISAVNVTIQPGGAISADSAGYNASTGPGYGGAFGGYPGVPCGGAGHGGYGGTAITNSSPYGSGGNFYDSPASPSSAGSGGGSYSTYSIGGKGGGYLILALSGNLQVDGLLSANGGNGTGTGGGGGSGGSLRITCANLTGSGRIAVNGGAGVSGIGGGGAGGMIYASYNSNFFSGVLSAYGGGGANYGSAGTIYFRTNSTGQTLLIADNGGQIGSNTVLAAANSLLVRNGAKAFAISPLTFTTLLVKSNAWLVPYAYPNNGTLNLTVLGNATLEAGGGILADAYGSQQNVGTGRGYANNNLPYFPCSGAGHGGYGASSISNLIGGGITFDSTTSPSQIGSGGGGFSFLSVGGNGGGYVRLQVNGTLQLDGSITANGSAGTGASGGGGSGGTIYLAPGTLNGSGNISANGGNGANLNGGGGGGGRIAIYFNNNNFTGGISAFGGGGANYGGAGTIYTKNNGGLGNNYGQLLLDNANHAGTNTSFDPVLMDVTIQNQAVGLLPLSGWTANNVLIRTNSALAAPASTRPQTLIANNLTIESGGSLNSDAAGYGSQSGIGYGNYSPTIRGGAGHGGYGGGNPSGGGRAYDSIIAPTLAGSGGASYNNGPPYSYGGNGGGALNLTVNGTLTLNGRLSSNGGVGGYNSGGGAGGSLNLTSINALTGSGVIAANGGSTTGAGGGGGGGRIALVCSSNGFAGQITATGGSGQVAGGAGTIYTAFKGTNTLLVDNGGITGTNTPLGTGFSMPNPPFNLNISGAAVVVPVTPLPLISNLNLAASATLTVPAAQSNLFLAVQKNAALAGNVTVDNLGYLQANGPGAGNTNANQGAGGGYGGAGGNSSSGATGGITYGSAAQPVDFGSGGGSGQPTTTGGSEGGGAFRLSVGGTLTVSGNVSANGDYGWQDNSGGGSGGSIWISTRTLIGTGNILARGGDGQPTGGGGGGGGRIAIYAPTNQFAGITNVNGGNGASPGQPGTIYLSSLFSSFLVISQSPTGLVQNTVGAVDLNFSEALDPASVSGADFTLVTPDGRLSPGSISATATGMNTVHVTFPVQNLLGSYVIHAATVITNIFGQALASPYSGGFTVQLPTISGTVTDTNHAPVANVLLQPDGGLIGVTTDVNGNYALGVPPGWNGTVTPALGGNMFVPGSQTYANVTDSLTNQNYLMVATIAPGLTAGLSGTNMLINWNGLTGVTYQTQWSTNLVDWLPLGDPVPGTNGPMQISLPLSSDPADFFRLGATN